MNLSLRTAAIVSGIGLAAMAILAPIGVMVALPAGQTGIAALVVLVVAMLDIVVAVALFPVIRSGGTLLAAIASATRLVYAAIFATAAGSLAADDPARFQAIWDAGLLIFGAHLILVGVAALRSSKLPTWLGILLMIAGAGYVLDSALVLVAPDSPLSLGEFTFIGEVVLLVWLLGWGGRPAKNRTAKKL